MITDQEIAEEIVQKLTLEEVAVLEQHDGYFEVHGIPKKEQIKNVIAKALRQARADWEEEQKFSSEWSVIRQQAKKEAQQADFAWIKEELKRHFEVSHLDKTKDMCYCELMKILAKKKKELNL